MVNQRKRNQHAVAVIPARGGSKRIPRKNIRHFCGKPIIAYSIEAAHQSELFSAVYVSTEDEEIAQVAEKYGAITIDRPISLADDFTPTIPVIRHAIGWLEGRVDRLDTICCIYPTVPFVQPEDLRSGYQVLCTGNWRFVFSAAEYNYPIQRSFRIDENEGVSMFDSQYFDTRTQDLERAYHDADKFYWGDPEAWKVSDRIFDESSTAIVVSSERVQVIDTEEDWVRAESMYRAITNNNQGEQYLKIIDKIEKIRTKNNVNWMDILRLAFRYAPKDAADLMLKINIEDDQISDLIKSLARPPE